MWTYVTCCMSQPSDRKPIELHTFSPSASEDVLELLVVTAHFHRTVAKLDVGHSVNFGRPWIDASICDRGLVSLPYLDGPSLEILKIDAAILNFYWLMPVTASEIEFKKRHGLDALEREFEKEGIDYLNPERKSIVEI